MHGIIGKVKDAMWRAMNAPNTEDADVYDDDTSGGDYVTDYKDDRPGDRDEQWEMPYAKEPRGHEKRARQAQNSKVLEMYGKDGNKAEIILRHPVDVSDAAKVCDYIREEKICVIDLTGVERSMAQRIADFLGGACYAINGTIQRFSKDIFIIVPNGVRIVTDIKDELEKDGYIMPKTHGRR
ncbi:MAG: cell division protein SepF [Defluviitaleaceae bacterium]|nr:cell division protein SepF [Defluviitaleaceae bacterium]